MWQKEAERGNDDSHTALDSCSRTLVVFERSGSEALAGTGRPRFKVHLEQIFTMIERVFDIPFVADLASREKQIQQNYRPIYAAKKIPDWIVSHAGKMHQ